MHEDRLPVPDGSPLASLTGHDGGSSLPLRKRSFRIYPGNARPRIKHTRTDSAFYWRCRSADPLSRVSVDEPMITHDQLYRLNNDNARRVVLFQRVVGRETTVQFGQRQEPMSAPGRRKRLLLCRNGLPTSPAKGLTQSAQKKRLGAGSKNAITRQDRTRMFRERRSRSGPSDLRYPIRWRDCHATRRHSGLGNVRD